MRRLVFLLSLVFASTGYSATLTKPIYAEVFIQPGKMSVSGNVTEWDATTVTMHVGSADRVLKWSELTAASAFTLRSRLIDKTKAEDWLALGEMGWKMGANEQGRNALMTARRMDASLADRVNAILSSPTSRPARPVVKPPTSAPIMYIKSTPEEDAKEIADAQKAGAAVGTAMKIKFQEVQTTHFIVFTDWDPRELDFLKTNIEGAYGAVAKQFDIPVKENVFVGKLPVFMFAEHQDFMRYAQEYDDMPKNELVLGYYAGHENGLGHMAMWKPSSRINGAEGQTPEEQWAYTLTHEFTHAFVDRYKTNRRIPRWLNEGLAEVVAQTQFPQPNRRELAKEMAMDGREIDQLFDDEQMPGGEYYPVMQTMVEMLIRRDRSAFIKYFDAIKDGEKAEKALQEIYGVDYGGLEKTWRQYMSR